MAKKKYTGTVTLRTARPRSRRLRELGIGGAVTISTTAGDSSSEGGGNSDYASEAGHAAEADHATSADTAQNLAQDSTDWQTIAQKDAETLESAKQYADGNFLSKTEADSAAGEITFLDGLKLGLQKLWGITKDGVATLANLVTQALRVNGSATVTGTMTSNRVTTNAISTGSLEASGDIGCGGRVDAGGEIHSEEKVSAPLGEFANANVGNTLTTKNLKVMGLAELFELVIDKLRAAGGAQLYTPADGFKVEAVTRFAYGGGYRRRLWWRATDGVKKSRNMWKAGDQAICMNFNAVDSAGTYQDVSNRWFWAVVAWCYTEKNTTPTWDNTNPEYVKAKAELPDTNAVPPNPYEVTDWHLIDLYCGAAADSPADQDGDGKDLWTGDIFNVAPGDEVAMLGHRRRGSEDDGELKRRQAAAYLSAYSSYDSELTPPFLAFYRGIDDFTLASHRTTYMDAVGSSFVGNFLSQSGDDLNNAVISLKSGLENVIAMAVMVDGVMRSGLKLTDSGIEIDARKLKLSGTMTEDVTIEGSKLHILNDLDLHGLTTENVTRVERNSRIPTIINMGILAQGDTDPAHVVKSVQVRNDLVSGYLPNGQPHMVVLPYFDDAMFTRLNDDWTRFAGNYINFLEGSLASPLFGSYYLFAQQPYGSSDSYADWQRRVVGWRENGTRLTVTNDVYIPFSNWQQIDNTQDPETEAKTALRLATVVCADGRIFAYENNPNADFYGTQANVRQNRCCLFSCGGYMARFIILLPGQSLQLRSQIIQYNGVNILVWVVENPSEFVPLTGITLKWTWWISQYDSRTISYTGTQATWNPEQTLSGTFETMLGARVLQQVQNETILFNQLYG